MQTSDVYSTNKRIKQAYYNSLASLLNLTFLPGLAFIYLLFKYKSSAASGIDHYHALFGIKLNLIALVILFFVCGIMIMLGGFHSPWTWVYVITYFTFVHTGFILVAVWAIVRAWSGQRVKIE